MSNSAIPASALAGSLPLPLIKTRLSLMMFLQYAIWGAWLPLLFAFMLNARKLELTQVGYILAAGAAGALFAPFISGQMADRSFNTEKVLGVSHILGAALVWFLGSISDFATLLGFAFAYSIVYSPTLSLTNSLALAHLPDRDRDFGKVRLWGTVGWICAGIGIGQWLLYNHTPINPDPAVVLQAQHIGMADAFRLSAILGVIMGIYCFFLPATPPAKDKKTNAAFKALGEVSKQPLLILFLIAIPMACVHQFYFATASGFLAAYQVKAQGAVEAVNAINRVFGVGGGGLMTIGQMSEIAVLGLVPLVSRRLSRKTLLAIGLAAYALRMAIFAYAPGILGDTSPALLPVLVIGVVLHGLCFGCFLFVGFLVIDENTTSDVRASAQSLFGLVVFGIGIIVGSIVASYLGTAAKKSAVAPLEFDYQLLFSYPMWASIICFVILLVAYPAGKRTLAGASKV